MKKIVIFLSLMLPSFSFGQHKIQPDSIITNVNILSAYLSEHYQPNKDSVMNNCLQLCVFVKFVINPRGKIDSVVFTKATPHFIINGLQKSVTKINSLLKLKDIQSYKGKTFIAPIIINNNQGCGHEYGAWDFPNEKKLTPQLKQLYAERQAAFEHTAVTARSITNFEDGIYDAINCVLLSAGYVGGVMY